MSFPDHKGRPTKVGGSLPRNSNLNDLFSRLKGGAGSGNRGHAGRIGKRGGSGPGNLSARNKIEQKDLFHEGGIERTARNLAAKWDVSEEDLKVLADEEKIVSGSDFTLKEAIVYDYLKTWVGSSGGMGEMYAISTVADKLGLKYNLSDGQRRVAEYIKTRPPIDRALTSLGEVMYNSTQDWLKEKGVKELKLLRAESSTKNPPATSWSLNWGGIRLMPGRNVVSEVIPAKNILSVPTTGFGNASESEVVVLPR